VTDTSAPPTTTEQGAVPDKWGGKAMTPTVEFFHSAVRKLVAERSAASGKSWEEAVTDPAMELTREDFERIEADMLATGYLFEYSAQVSFTEAPEKHKPEAGVGDSGNQPTDEQGRPIVGTGDNVFKAKADLTGTARFITTVEVVMQMLTEGVPEGTIAVIDDSGGTLTAPILEDFAGVVCMGGTIRSHLGILTREYNIPCLMAAELDGLSDGDAVLVEYSKPAADVYAARDDSARARIVKTS
jgi:phosphohistidine swiveling domain-containing protein